MVGAPRRENDVVEPIIPVHQPYRRGRRQMPWQPCGKLLHLADLFRL